MSRRGRKLFLRNIVTQIMHDIIVVTLSDTSAWEKNSTRPYPTISEIGRSQLDSAQILKESIGPAGLREPRRSAS